MNPKKNREKLIETMFEKYGVQGMIQNLFGVLPWVYDIPYIPVIILTLSKFRIDQRCLCCDSSRFNTLCTGSYDWCRCRFW